MSDDALASLEALQRRNAQTHWVNRDLYRLLYRLVDQPSIVHQLQGESFGFAPSRPAPSNKAGLGESPLVSAAMHSMLEAIYDSPHGPWFRDSSFGFRRGRGRLAALAQFRRCWSDVVWMVAGRIGEWSFERSKAGSARRSLLMTRLEEKIADGRFLNLIHKALTAAYAEPDRAGQLDGPLGSILTNLYLHPMDELVESFPSVRYLRHGRDWLLGVTGPKSNATAVRNEMASLLRDRLSIETLALPKVMHALSREAMFLDVRVGTRIVGGHPRTRMKAPIDDLTARLHQQGFCRRDGFPTSRSAWIHLDEDQLIRRYNRLHRGLLTYYRFVDQFASMKRIQYILHYSLAMTLAHKHRTSMTKVFQRYGRTLRCATRNTEGADPTTPVEFRLHRDWTTRPTAFSYEAKPHPLDSL